MSKWQKCQWHGATDWHDNPCYSQKKLKWLYCVSSLLSFSVSSVFQESPSSLFWLHLRSMWFINNSSFSVEKMHPEYCGRFLRTGPRLMNLSREYLLHLQFVTATRILGETLLSIRFWTLLCLIFHIRNTDHILGTAFQKRNISCVSNFFQDFPFWRISPLHTFGRPCN